MPRRAATTLALIVGAAFVACDDAGCPCLDASEVDLSDYLTADGSALQVTPGDDVHLLAPDYGAVAAPSPWPRAARHA